MRRLLVVVLLSACAPLPIIDAARYLQPPGPSRVLEILNRHQCAKCHTTDSVFVAPGVAGEAETPPEPRDVRLPTLASMQRFRARWLREFLAAPYVVRPNLAERMIVHDLKPWEIEVLISGWGAVAEPVDAVQPPASELARGAELFEAKQCGLCHLFGARRFSVAEGWQFLKTPTIVPRALAPDLQHARRRLTPETLAAWIENPAAVKPTSPMPRVQMTPEEAKAIAAWIAFGLDTAPPAEVSTAP